MIDEIKSELLKLHVEDFINSYKDKVKIPALDENSIAYFTDHYQHDQSGKTTMSFFKFNDDSEMNFIAGEEEFAFLCKVFNKEINLPGSIFEYIKKIEVSFLIINFITRDLTDEELSEIISKINLP